MGSAQCAEILWSAPEGRQNCLVFRAQTGLEICSVNFEQLVVLVVMVATASSSLALVWQGTVGKEGRETAGGLFALKVG